VISNYAELQTAVAAWMHRTDLTSLIPDFITLAEEKFNRRLRTRQMETALTATDIVDGEITIPANTVAVKSLWVSAFPEHALKSQSLESVMALGSEGIPTAYAWNADTWRFDGTGTIEGVLYRSIPAVSSGTNWLLTASPSVYLFGSLSEAMIYAKETQEAGLWSARCDAIIEELNGNDRRDKFSGPLIARAR
jgi:hypothetical protein